ncbi:uncharacterized protein MYCFIDRAFT_173666 [Pseudocercospora fijiensis CIRAD86]|uniref:Uncharacterized protein n=1 Tax=Pseudocercospora fijiensis (strain CIRAD86) TaxID=383855 RepID=M2Z4K5_PSEFD|nr:uncharacterized protein MYCFIDRAFT_173666 [Pseudocercospora fijiensis CIRAD86]EME84730.1 hypothetical protein MYCFIDRAFT_173666 [Pseudocercospora fijiensis CIRAD86]
MIEATYSQGTKARPSGTSNDSTPSALNRILLLNSDVSFDIRSVLAPLSSAQNVSIDRWSFIDFATGSLHYKSNGAGETYNPSAGQASTTEFDTSTSSNIEFKVLGTTGLDTCTGLIIVSRKCCVVAQFSSGGLSTVLGGSISETPLATAFRRFVLERRHHFEGTTLAVIFRPSRVVHRMGSHQPRDSATGESVTRWAFVPIEARMDEHDTTGIFNDILILTSILTGSGLPRQNVRMVTECHPYSGRNGPGHTCLLVDGRSSPGAFPQLYANLYDSSSGREVRSQSIYMPMSVLWTRYLT